MIEIAWICLAGLIIISLFTIYRLMFIKPGKEFIGSWKTGMFLLIIASGFFFIYFILTIGSVGLEQTITDGTINFVVDNNDYLPLFSLMPIAQVIFFMQFIFFAIEFLRGMQFFGRSRITFD